MILAGSPAGKVGCADIKVPLFIYPRQTKKQWRDIIYGMSIRFAKQIIYGAFYVLVWALVVWIGYGIFFHPAPPVPPQAAASAQPISVLSVNEFISSPGHATFIAKIANLNSALAAQYFSFSFGLLDGSGTVLQSFPGASFLYPNEVKYVALVNQAVGGGSLGNTTSAGAIATITIPTSTTEWVASSSFGLPPNFSKPNYSTSIGSSTATVTGQLTNNDTATFSHIFIIAIFNDANGNPVGASQTEIDSIAPNQTEVFSVSYPAVPGINPAATEMQAYVER